ncbi:MAG: HAD family phosphatase [Methylococcales bacterium]|nr:HAD family phosphatase [Methylococcales bacterium]
MKPFIAFDLGNVLIPFDHMKACRALGAIYSLDPQYVYERIFEGGIVPAFDLGNLSPSDFTQECSDALKVNLCEDTLIDAWSNIFSHDPEMEKLIEELAENADLCLISNTNCWHYNSVLRDFPFVEHFPRKLLSFKIHKLKPDPEVFRLALRWAQRGQINIFIDDIEENVNSAASVGFNAIHFSGIVPLRESLRRLGVKSNQPQE